MRRVGIGTAVCLAWAGIAHATPDADALRARRLQAEQEEKDGHFVQCGQSYLDMVKTWPDAAEVPVLLYNAGACFSHGGQLGAAIKMRELLIKHAPGDPLAIRAMSLNADSYLQIAYFAEAAELFETWVKKFGGERETLQALETAAWLRRGLGQTARFTADVDFYAKQYGAKQRARAGDFAFSLVAYLHERARRGDAAAPKQLETALASWQRSWGNSSGVDRKVLVEAWLGELALAKSCPRGDGGACIAPMPRPPPAACGKSPTPFVTAKRSAAAAGKVARLHLERAVQLWHGGDAARSISAADEGERQVRTGAAAYWAAAARLWLADQKLELLGFQSKTPVNLAPWLRTVVDAVRAASADYEATLKGSGPLEWRIAALYRIGQLYQQLAAIMDRTPLPKGLGPESREAYCRSMNLTNQAVIDKAQEAFATCLDTAIQTSTFSRWSARCDAALQIMDPVRYPAAVEIVPALRPASSATTSPPALSPAP